MFNGVKMSGIKIKHLKRIAYITVIIVIFILSLTLITHLLLTFKYCNIDENSTGNAINETSSNIFPLRRRSQEHEYQCSVAIIAGFVIYSIFVILGLIIIGACLSHLCTFSYFEKGSQKTTKELLLKADRQVSNNWTITEQVGKFYLKDFRRLLKKQYKKETGLFLAGSVGERFGKPICTDLDKSMTYLMTDFDYMIYLKDIFAVTAIERNSDIYIQTREKDIMPGYAKLYSMSDSTSIFPTEKGGVLSTAHLMKQLYKLLGNTDISFYPGFRTYSCWYCRFQQTIRIQRNGPALRVNVRNPTLRAKNQRFSASFGNGFLADIVFSIYTPEWPEASDWPSRNKRNWPLASHVEYITKNGCHLIPKSQTNDTKKITWRFSFSYAEVQLSKLINPVAKNCFLCLKIISRNYLEPRCEGFKSYHLKTIFYYTLEKSQIELWTEESIEKGFEKLLDELLQTLTEKRCPHFWISGIDLYEGIKKSGLESLQKIVLKIRENPALYIKETDGLNALNAHLCPQEVL